MRDRLEEACLKEDARKEKSLVALLSRADIDL